MSRSRRKIPITHEEVMQALQERIGRARDELC